MSTPNKRRKKNDQQSSQPGRKLDFFFGRQKEKEDTKAAAPAPVAERSSQSTENGLLNAVEGDELTDEQLARKLQAQWDEQERAAREGNSTANGQETGVQTQNERSNESSEKNGASDPSGDDVKPDEPVTESKPKPANNAFAAMSGKNTLSLQSATAEEDTKSHAVPFDQSPLTFDPQKYLPDLKAQWTSEGGAATYAILTHCFVLVNSTQSRIKIVDTLVNFLRTIIEGDPAALLPAVWLATNSISPPYIDIELGLGGSAISKALKKVCGLDNAALKTLYNKHGDAGDVAFEAKKRQSLTLRKPKPLTIASVFDTLLKIAHSKGSGSVEAKQRLVERLVQDARGAEESRYIVRTLVQHLRIGAVKTTMLIALSRAFLLSRPPDTTFPTTPASTLIPLSKQDLAHALAPAENLVKASFARHPNYADLIPALLDLGITPALLQRCGLALHVPLRPMLGGITRDVPAMLTRLRGRAFTAEFKYDGQRAQVHCDASGSVTIFSRHLEVMTEKYPDLVALVPRIRGEGVRSFILEGEVVAVERASGELRPFQVLANRARKGVEVGEVRVQVCLFAFDLMFLNGEELLGRSLRERRGLLRSMFVESPGAFTWVKSLDVEADDEDVEVVSEFFKQATDVKCEGIMVKVLDNPPESEMEAGLLDEDGTEQLLPPPPPPPKTKKKTKPKTSKTQPRDPTDPDPTPTRRKPLPATYTPDKRLDAWLKVKKDYNTSTSETIDLIPVGAWHGNGRKAAWWSPILLACRNDETGALEVVTKCMSGFSDAFYKANRARYRLPGEGGEGGEEGEDEDGSGGGGGPLNTIPRPSYVEYAHTPDVWFEPQEVWEVAFADVTLSPTYTAARDLVGGERGLSLRFPRFLRVRDDKGVEEASTGGLLAGLWWRQGERGEGEGEGEGVVKREEDVEEEVEKVGEEDE